jgi:hypothetical protein
VSETLIIRIEESDYLLAAQSLDRDQVFCRASEFLAVLGEEMSLDVARTSPLETAERAVPRWLMHILPVPCEFLGAPKAFVVAIGTDSPHLAVFVTTAAVLTVGTLDSCSIPSGSGSVGTARSLGCVGSNNEKPGNAYLAG